MVWTWHISGGVSCDRGPPGGVDERRRGSRGALEAPRASSRIPECDEVGSARTHSRWDRGDADGSRGTLQRPARGGGAWESPAGLDAGGRQARKVCWSARGGLRGAGRGRSQRRRAGGWHLAHPHVVSQTPPGQRKPQTSVSAAAEQSHLEPFRQVHQALALLAASLRHLRDSGPLGVLTPHAGYQPRACKVLVQAGSPTPLLPLPPQ